MMFSQKTFFPSGISPASRCQVTSDLLSLVLDYFIWLHPFITSGLRGKGVQEILTANIKNKILYTKILTSGGGGWFEKVKKKT